MPTKEIGAAYLEMMERIGKIFPSEPGLRTARKYMQGLLSPIARKNGWQMAEAVGDTTPYVLQQFLYRGQFSADELRDELRGYGRVGPAVTGQGPSQNRTCPIKAYGSSVGH